MSIMTEFTRRDRVFEFLAPIQSPVDVRHGPILYLEDVTVSFDGFKAINNLNLTIRRLTLITIILMVPTLIASFYGMNVPLPAQESPYMSMIIIGASVVLSLLVTWYFQRKRLF